MNDELLTQKGAARELGLHPRTLRRLITEGNGPPSITLARRPMYRRGDLRAWFAKRGQPKSKITWGDMSGLSQGERALLDEMFHKMPTGQWEVGDELIVLSDSSDGENLLNNPEALRLLEQLVRQLDDHGEINLSDPPEPKPES